MCKLVRLVHVSDCRTEDIRDKGNDIHCGMKTTLALLWPSCWTPVMCHSDPLAYQRTRGAVATYANSVTCSSKLSYVGLG
jgi:hypothetical protein